MKWAWVLLVASLAGCLSGTQDGESIPGPQDLGDVDAGERVQFLLIGDQGTQDEDQYNTAQAMKRVCDDRGCDFVIALGDNIYDVGPVAGPMDPQFQTAFEEPYADFDIPFYLTLGNHDNGATGGAIVNGDHEVAYTYSEDSSGKWRMPSRYYTQSFSNGSVQIWSLDTDTLTAGDSTSGIRLGPDVLYSRDPQIAWMQESIQGSDARWKLVFGHYHYSTEGYYGDGDPFLKDSLEQFACDQVQFYFFGHQHQLRWLEAVESCGRTEFINSGAAARETTGDSEEKGIDQYFVYQDGAGFWWVEIVGDTFNAEAYGTGDDPTEPVLLFNRTTTLQELGW